MIAGGKKSPVGALFLSDPATSVIDAIFKPNNRYLRSIKLLSLLLYMSDYLHEAKKNNENGRFNILNLTKLPFLC